MTKHNKRNKSRKNMKGGNFSPNEIQQLSDSGFNDYQIDLLQNLDISYDDVMEHYEQLTQDNYIHGNSDDVAEQVTMDIYNQHNLNDSNISNIQQNEDDEHFMDMDESQGSLHLSDLNTSQDSDLGYTTTEDFSQNNETNENDVILGGKDTKNINIIKINTKKSKKRTNHINKSRKHKKHNSNKTKNKNIQHKTKKDYKKRKNEKHKSNKR